MTSNKTITNLLKQYSWQTIEPHIIYFYLSERSLNYQKNELLNRYFSDFTKNEHIYKQIKELNIFDLKDLESILELLIPQSDKIINGAFFTPSYIVDFIVKTVHPEESSKCIDLSCGGGAFLIGLCDYYRINFGKSIKSIVRDNIYGADILDYNIMRSKIILTIYGLQNNEYLEETDFNLINTDSLKYNWNLKFDIIVGNPPYVKFQDLLDDTRMFLAKKWHSCSKGTFNLYFAFFELGYNLLTNNGRLGYITPNNYFTSLAGEYLRDFFCTNKCIFKILDFNSTKVFSVQTYTAITFLNKENNSQIAYDRITNGTFPSKFLEAPIFSNTKYSELKSKKWRLLKQEDRKNIQMIESVGTPIGQLFMINVGIATLKDDLYFINVIKEDEFTYIIKAEGREFEIEKGITRPLYKISDFKTQDELKNNKRRIIFPYEIVNNLAVTIDENQMNVKYPKCLEYFIFIKDKLKNRDKGKKPITPFYAYGRTQGLTKTGIKLLTPTFSQSPRFLLVLDKEALFTNGYGIFFKNNITNNIFSEPHPLALEKNVEALQKLLNSRIMDYYIKQTSVSIEGGYPCYQKNFIEKFTIPSFTETELTEFTKLSVKEDIDNYLINKYQVNLPSPNLEL